MNKLLSTHVLGSISAALLCPVYVPWLIGSLDCFSLSFAIGPSEYFFLERFSTECRKIKTKAMNLFGDAAAILDSIVSNNYYRMLRGEQ